MNTQPQTLVRNRDSVLASNKLIRNTYTLLSMTLLFSAATATFALTTNAPYLGPWLTLGIYFGLLMVTTSLRNSAWGLVSVFALTGFLGYSLGPLINAYLHMYTNGSMLVGYAMGATGVIFLGLSGYALTSRRDFSYMGGFLAAGILIAFLAAVANIFFAIPALALVVSSLFVLLMAGLILWQTSAMVHGGETNYIMATVTLYVALFNLFTSLLQILGVFAGDD
ncbi:MAG: Bax inhibitor-1/YccA family protein [Acidiferrobacteraceae bacterium]|jgi:modulator of FtsH protease